MRIALTLFLASLAAFSYAKETTVSFAIAPPPVGYPVFEAGSSVTQTGAGAVYLSMDWGGERFTVLGASAFASFQHHPGRRLALNGAGGGTFLLGNKYDMQILQLPVSGTAVYEALRFGGSSLLVFGGLGATLGLLSMTVTIPQWVPYTTIFIDDDTRLSTTTVTGSLSAGLQANLRIRDFIFSPFGSYTYTTGSYSTTQTSSMSFDYPSSSGEIPGSSSYFFGFDLLYVPWDLALSSQMRGSKDYSLYTLSLKWLIKRLIPKAGVQS